MGNLTFTTKRVREVYDDNRSPTCQKGMDGDEENLCDLNGSLDVMLVVGGRRLNILGHFVGVFVFS